MKAKDEHHRRLSAREIKHILSEEEFADARDKIEQASKTLGEVSDLLSSALFLHNGKLSTGAIDYAAFRIETLSLIFEVAFQNFCRSAKTGPKAYDEFLLDLGDRVGFTFARDLVNRLKGRDLFIEAQDMRKLLELWTLYENETGAGVTKLKNYAQDKVVIQLVNNPLRRSETSPHKHCGFYCSYIRSLLNEMLTSRSRLLQTEIELARIPERKVVRVSEHPDAEDNCIFVAELRAEILTRSFDALYKAYEQFYDASDTDDFSPCAAQARAALVSAQMESIGLKAERAPAQLFKVFEEVLSREDFRRMDEVFQRASKYVHRETTTDKLSKRACWDILNDVRRSVYAFEFLGLTEEQCVHLRDLASLKERLDILEAFIQRSEAATPQERNEVIALLSRLKKGMQIEEAHQERLLGFLRKLGEKAWEIAKPVLIQVISEALKKKYGLS